MFWHNRGDFPTGLSVGELSLAECIFPGVFRRDDLRREITFSDVNDHPDPLLCKNIQEFCIEQGVGGSKSGPVSSSVPEKRGIRARIGDGLRMV